MKYDCIIIGAGASGLMAAATAGYRGRKILVLDSANKVGKKILMSGGGRCNFTNYYVEPESYTSNNPHFCKSALSRYTSYDFIEMVSKYKLEYHERANGQLFCDNRSNDILDILLSECEKADVKIITNCKVDRVEKNDGFILDTTSGQFTCDSLLVATGGLSIPILGATGFGYQLAKQFGLRVTATHAALVPYTFSGKWLDITKNLSGISMEVEISTNSTSFQGPLLFTHRGISGPAVLQSSNYWKLGEEITINFFPTQSLEGTIQKWREEGKKRKLSNLLAEELPKQFVNTWLQLFGEDKPANQYSDKEIKLIAEQFQQWKITPAGTEGYRKAEVTQGGIDTDEISSKTFEAQKVSNLFFTGEVLDVTGQLGGFNFQWAWSSGYCAGQYI
ncbi:MAG: aminoacetone oxidase family FAD-binding enzyme [SAR324 cluster bacterium]|uniref:Aminoacetone oxidase family FAD-binding enzyme n=1 Tax=SAR324 cluster bacterium TaxID=2024889 RepID=A0A2A4T2Q7_9DELT|nr:MAG: aminoacetone oxidase family FAD-binding enzyme [SAR324 cluster bacterium]